MFLKLFKINQRQKEIVNQQTYDCINSLSVLSQIVKTQGELSIF